MTRGTIAISMTAAVLAGLSLAAAVLHARDVANPVAATTDRLMYVTSGAAADRLVLSFDVIAADVYWIRVIQHYARERKAESTTGRFELLQPLLDITTTLDPHFGVAYRYGAIFLALNPPDGPGRPDQAIALLEKGLASDPARWQFAYDIGFIHYFYTFDYQAAARWFEKAGAMPNAPEWIKPLAAMTLLQGGDRESARFMWSQLRASPEQYIRLAAERGLLQVQALDEIDLLQTLIDRYQALGRGYPTGWMDLVRARMLGGIPADPSGTPYIYDPATHEPLVAPASPLNPLPRALVRK